MKEIKQMFVIERAFRNEIYGLGTDNAVYRWIFEEKRWEGYFPGGIAESIEPTAGEKCCSQCANYPKNDFQLVSHRECMFCTCHLT